MSRRRLGTILAHELRLIARDPLPVMVLIAFPIITMAFVKPAFAAALQQTGYPDANGAEQVVPGPGRDERLLHRLARDVRVLLRVRVQDVGPRARERGDLARDRRGQGDPARRDGDRRSSASCSSCGVVLFDLHIAGNALALLPLIVAFSISLVLLGVAVTAVCHSAQQANAFSYAGSCCSARSAARWCR